MLQPMRIFTTALVIAASTLWTASVYASPAHSTDPIDRLISDKGLLNQIDHVRQNVSHRASELVVNAMGFLGVPYKRGGNNENGFDCSGFVRTMYQQSVGLLLPRRAEQQAAATQKIEKSELQPGDLVFFNTLKRTFSHVGIYVGEGNFIHAPKPGAEVRVESMAIRYWQSRFDGARRVTTAERTAPLSTEAQALINDLQVQRLMNQDSYRN